MLESVVMLLLASQPATPSLSKWTKLGPCVDFYIRANVYGLLGLLFDAAFQSIRQRGPPQVDARDKGDCILNDMLWHATVGKRHDRAVRFLGSDAKQPS